MSVDRLILKTKRAMHERLFTLTRLMREGEGGAVACCGSFRPDFVKQLHDTPITDDEAKALIKVLKAVSGGARRMLRIAAELQLGLNGVNWRQTTMVQFYKTTDAPKRTRIIRSWADTETKSSSTTDDRIKKKNSKNKMNDKITMNHIFDNSQIGNIVYWEIKAG